MTPWRLAFKELRRNSTRSALMAAAVAITAIVMTAVLLLIIGVRQGLTQTVDRLGADIMVVPAGEKIAKQFNDALISGTPAEFYLAPSSLEKLSHIQALTDISTQTFARTLNNASCCAGEFFIVGFDPQTDFTIAPWLRDNRTSLPNTDENWMIVGDRILLDIGDTADFFGVKFTAKGVLEPTSTGMDWTIYIPDKALRRLVADSPETAEAPLRIPDRAVSAVFIKTADNAHLIDVAESIEQADPDLQVILSSSVAAAARGQVSAVTALLTAVVAVLWIMAMLLCGVVFSQAVRQRRSEIGLLMAKGADLKFILGLLLRESAAISIAASLLGCITGLLIIIALRQTLTRILDVPEVLPSLPYAAALVISFVILLAAAAITASMAPVIPMFTSEPFESVKRGTHT